MIKEENLKAKTLDTGESRIFARDIIWVGVAQLFISLILGIITLPALTKSYTPEIFGIWVQVSLTVELISPLLTLQLGLAVIRFLAGSDDRNQRRQSLGAMLSAILIFAGIMAITGFLLAGPLSALLFDNPVYVRHIHYLVIWAVFNALFNFLLSYLRARGKIREISLVQVSMVVLKMVSIVGLANAGASLDSIFISMTALQVFFSISVFMMTVKDTGLPILNTHRLGTFLAFSVPQMPCIMLLWVISVSDRYFITHLLGLSQNGIYSSSNTLAGLISIFYAPISFVLYPMIARLWEQKRSEDVKSYFGHSTRLFLTCAIPGAIGISLLSQPLLTLLTTSEFLVGEGLVLLLAFGAVFLGIYQINANLILLGKQAKYLALMTAAATVFSIAGNILLIPHTGIMGAAVSNCLAYLVLAVITTIWARKTMRYELHLKYLGKIVLSSLIMLIGLYFLNIKNIWGLLLGIAAGGTSYILLLFLLKAFTRQDKELIRSTFASLFSWSQRKKLP